MPLLPMCAPASEMQVYRRDRGDNPHSCCGQRWARLHRQRIRKGLGDTTSLRIGGAVLTDILQKPPIQNLRDRTTVLASRELRLFLGQPIIGLYIIRNIGNRLGVGIHRHVTAPMLGGAPSGLPVISVHSPHRLLFQIIVPRT